MVRCIDFGSCIKLISDLDDRKIFVCQSKIRDMQEQDNPEKWKLWDKNSGVLEKMAEVKLFEDRACPDFRARRIFFQISEAAHRA